MNQSLNETNLNHTSGLQLLLRGEREGGREGGEGEREGERERGWEGEEQEGGRERGMVRRREGGRESRKGASVGVGRGLQVS